MNQTVWSCSQAYRLAADVLVALVGAGATSTGVARVAWEITEEFVAESVRRGDLVIRPVGDGTPPGHP